MLFLHLFYLSHSIEGKGERMIGLFNSDQRMSDCIKYLHDEAFLIDENTKDCSCCKVFVLPMSGISQGCVFLKGKRIDISHLLAQLSSDCVVISGRRCEELELLSQRVVILDEVEEFVEVNAELTAEGVLYYLLDNKKLALNQLHVDLLGYGHCGKAIYHLLRSLNVNVRVVRRQVRHESDQFICLETYRHCQPSQVIINTSIVNWLDDFLLAKLKPETLIINIVGFLAFNESLIREKYSRLLHLKALPAMIASESAAIMLAKIINKEIEHGR